jgi:putative endonuclease
MSKSWFVYIVICQDSTFYTGITKAVAARISAHNAGKGAKYTRSRLPVELQYYEEYETESEARKREYELKHMTRSQKASLVDNFPPERISALLKGEIP